MGFYIRKGFNFGPLRLNLSRSGLGASFGVKGARIGIGPRGSYVHMGRGGLYYRQSLTPTSHTTNIRPPALPGAAPSDNLHEIASAAAVTLADSSATDLLAELNRVKKRTDRLPIIAVTGIIVICVLGTVGTAWWLVTLALAAAIILALYARHFDVLQGTAILNYSLESEAAQDFAKLQAPFRQLAVCEGVWHIDAAGHHADTKYNAGATTTLKRTEIRPTLSRPPKVQCNLELPTLKAGNTTLYFFPDRLLVYDAGGVGAVAYADLKVETQESRFVENGRVPRDSRQIGTTWQYVNNKGGPDRRFSNNPQLPVMQYGAFGFSSASGLSALFLCSPSEIANSFHTAFPQVTHQQPLHAQAPSKGQPAQV
jgi:Protein of unknown function (DUF4236)